MADSVSKDGALCYIEFATWVRDSKDVNETIDLINLVVGASMKNSVIGRKCKSKTNPTKPPPTTGSPTAGTTARSSKSTKSPRRKRVADTSSKSSSATRTSGKRRSMDIKAKRKEKCTESAAKDIQRLYRGKKGRQRALEKKKKINLKNNATVTISREDIKHLKQVYDDIDVDGSDSVTIDEYALAVKTETWISPHVAGMFHALDMDGDGSVSFSEVLNVAIPHATEAERKAFLSWLGPKNVVKKSNRRALTASDLTEMRALFHLYDADGSGCISKDELREVLMSIGVYSNDECESMIKESFGKATMMDFKMFKIALMGYIDTSFSYAKGVTGYDGTEVSLDD